MINRDELIEILFLCNVARFLIYSILLCYIGLYVCFCTLRRMSCN